MSDVVENALTRMRYTIHLNHGGPRRFGHAAVFVGDYIYSFGGYCADYYYQGEIIDVHVLNTNTMRWSLVLPKVNEDGTPLRYPQVPYQRYAHTVVAYKNKIYLWGGRPSKFRMPPCNILYCFDTETRTWSQPHVTGAKPGVRYGHSACVVGNSMYIFGRPVEAIIEHSFVVHCLNLDTMEWHNVQAYGMPSWVPDLHNKLAAINNRIYIYGKRDGPHRDIQIVYLDLETKVWHFPLTTGKVPVVKGAFSMFTYNGLIYVFGGYNCILDRYFNDLYTFNPQTNFWNLVKPLGTPPSARGFQVCILKGTRMYLFGGKIGQITYCDTYVLDFEPNLKTLALSVVIENHLDTTCLPEGLKWEIRSMTEPMKNEMKILKIK